MFMDGSIYASLANNLVQGYGSFWDPYLSADFHPSFHEHPPLAFGLQAIFFKIMGNHFWVEKLYSILMLFLHIYILKAFWKELNTTDNRAWWWPALLYSLIPTISWSFSNNMLENTIGVFSSLAVFILFKNRQSLNWRATFLAALSLLLAFHAKGPVSAFPLISPFFIWFVYREFSFTKMLIHQLGLIVLTVGLFLLLMYSWDDAMFSWQRYFNKQVVGTLEKESGSFGVRRTFILERLFLEMLIPIIVMLATVVFNKLKKSNPDKGALKHIVFFLLIGGSAILPIMLSPKQWSFYSVPSIFYFTIAVAVFTFPMLHQWLIRWGEKKLKIVRMVSIVILLGVGLYSASQYGTIGRDKDKLHDVFLIFEKIPNEKRISGHGAYKHDWGLLSYFIRYGNLSIDFENIKRDYLIAPANGNKPKHYEAVEGDWKTIILYQRK